MTVSTELSHYTISTGHLRMSPRREVSAEAIDALQPMIAPGEHAIPGMPGYRVRVTIEGRALAATVLAPSGAPLSTTFVCPDDASLQLAAKAAGAVLAQPLALPAALVELHPTISLDRGSSSWLGDFERCLAWSWIEQCNRY